MTETPSYEAQVAQLRSREEQALAMGGPDKLRKRRETSMLNARERIAGLLDPGSFKEVGLLTTAANPKDRARSPADGKITGFGLVEQRRIAVVANDLTVMGASSAPVNARKIAYMKEAATRNGMPLVFLGESTGSRIPDTLGSEAMAQGGQDSQQYCRRRETPWASAVLGACLGSSTWYSCISDFVVMRKGAFLAVSSAKVTEVAIGEAVNPEELGGWRLHAETTGLIDRVVDSDEEALAEVRSFLGYLPSHAGEAPPRRACSESDVPDNRKLIELVPLERSKVYDMRKVIPHIVDRDSFFMLKDRFGKSAVTGLARLDGQSVGIVASNPYFKAGAMDPAACRKVTSFLVLCDSFNIPVVFLVDTPGFLVGVEGERSGAPAHIMNMIHALQLCSVPKVSVILRKSFGQAYLNMGGGRNSDDVAAWVGADVSFMDPGVAVSVLHNVRRSDEPERFEALKAELTRETSAFALAGAFGVQTVLDPRETRSHLIGALAMQQRARGAGQGRHEMCTWPTYL